MRASNGNFSSSVFPKDSGGHFIQKGWYRVPQYKLQSHTERSRRLSEQNALADKLEQERYQKSQPSQPMMVALRELVQLIASNVD